MLPKFLALTLLAPALTLKVPVTAGAGPSAHVRRGVLGGAAALFASQLARSAAFAYDTIPEAMPDFAEAERKRKAREQIVKKETEALMPYVKKIEATTTAEEFEKVRASRPSAAPALYGKLRACRAHRCVCCAPIQPAEKFGKVRVSRTAAMPAAPIAVCAARRFSP
jgi:hypothetical protein